MAGDTALEARIFFLRRLAVLGEHRQRVTRRASNIRRRAPEEEGDLTARGPVEFDRHGLHIRRPGAYFDFYGRYLDVAAAKQPKSILGRAKLRYDV